MKKITKFLFVFFLVASWHVGAQISVVENFDSGTSLPMGWTQAGGTTIAAADACFGNSIRDNLYGSSTTGTLTSPNQVAASNATDLTFSFDYKIENWNSSTAAPAGWGSTQLQYSLDDGTTWTTFHTIDDTNHVVSNVCTTVTQIIPLASLPAGSDFKFRFSHTWASGDWDIYIDNITVNQVSTNPPSCTALSVPANGATGITNTVIAWPIASGIPTGYKLSIGTTTGGTDVLNMVDVGNVNTYDMVSLGSGTTYYVTVVPYNALGDATGCTESTFTSCGALVAPFSEGFENSGSIPNCWTMSGGENWQFSNTPGINHIGNNGNMTGFTPSGNYFAWVDDSGTPPNDVTLTSPPIDISALTTPRIVFYEISDNEGSNENATLNVEVWDGAAWNLMATYNTNTIGWEKKIISLNSLTFTGNFIQVRFIILGSPSQFYDDIAIDDVSVQETPNCVEPSSFAGSNITATTIDLSWTDPTGQQFDFEYTVQAQGTGVPTVSGTPIDQETVTAGALTPLMPNTLYEAWIRADCGTEYSDWVGPIYFKTLCSVYTAPWTYDVETAVATTNASIEDCWSTIPTVTTALFRWNVDASGSTPTTGTGPSGANSGTNYFYTEGSSGATGAVAELYSPLVDVSGLTTPSLQFYYHMFGNNMGDLHVDVFDGTTWINDVDVIIGQQQTAEADIWALRIVDLSAYNGTIQVRFRGIRGNGGNSDMSLDDISFVEAPTCFPVTDVTVDFVTDTTVQIGWTDGTATNTWNIEYGPVGFTPGTGTVVAAGVNPYLLGSVTPLTPNTTYEFYVQANCGAGDLSLLTGPISFSTLCAPVSAPWTYDVETGSATTNSSIGDCWSSNPSSINNAYRWDLDDNGSTPSGGTGPSGAYSGTKYFYTEASSGVQGDVAELYTPLVNISALTAPSLQFYYHMFGVTMGDLHVDVFDGTAWVNDVDIITGQQQLATSDPWILKVISLASYSGIIQVRFRAVRGNGLTGDISLDNIAFVEAPSCLPPTSFAANNITDISVELSWADMSAVSQFDFEYVIQPQGTGTPSAAGIPISNATSVVDNTLTPVTAYEAWIRADCGNGTYSSWVGPVNFATTCAVYSVPSVEDFSIFVPDCWEKGDNGDLVAGPAAFGAGSWFADGFSNNGTTGAIKVNFYNLSSNEWMMTPLYNIPATGYEMKFDAALTQWNQTYAPTTPWDAGDRVEVLVSTGFTNWTVLYTYDNTNPPLASGSTNIIDLDAYAGSIVRFAFRVISGPTDGSDDTDFFVDNFEIRLTPTTPPTCAANVVGTPDATCGNFTSTLTWDAVSGADGYLITLGTTSGGNDVLDNVDLGVALSYDYIGTLNTTYYFTITPYNANGNAAGCTEATFTTNANGCYCTSVPTSIDNNGVTNVLIGTTNYPNGVVAYADYTTTGTPQDLERDALANLQVTFETGFTYGTNVWIDFNDDYNFDSSELVSSGTSLSTNPTTLDVSFTMPADAALGNHRMRIGTADSGQVPPNPCYSGTWGVTLDFTVNIIENLSTATFMNSSFKVYPNPVTNILKLEYNTEITNVKVANMLGQIVIDVNMNSTNTQVNMSHLNAGTYMVNVTIGDSIKTVKVVKQ
ncbi:fibronectin type III domain-containing protein [Flavobacterium chuncheonense]|uniref:Fibronectin type III domain-containing protein n=1 Tax=Flavobacterium chuncheonense TaxID=2026653 RepID=A0ABW5YK33_9FLAO